MQDKDICSPPQISNNLRFSSVALAWRGTTFDSGVFLVYLSTNQPGIVSSLLSIYLSGCVRCRCLPACSRASPALTTAQATTDQAAAAAAAKRLFWHLTARQIFTASSSVRLSHRKYPTHPLARLRFFLLYSQIGNLYFFRNDLFCRRHHRRREIVSLIGSATRRLLRPIK